ncbi:protein of unknown function [uncultured Mediterranean phage uvMED]|nr:protein of unknown function [uncultured Mediterranean phage uvMED]
MAIQRVHQNSFSRGEVDDTVVTRTDVGAYQQALRKARNVFCLNQGAVERRQGSLYRADLGEQSRLEPFIFSADQEYIFAFQNTKLKIFSTNGTLLQTLSSCPWVTAELFELTYTQSGDTMIICHTNFNPQIIKRTGATTFTRTAFTFKQSTDTTQTFQPYFKFADDVVTLDIDQTTPQTGVNLVTSAAYFESSMVGNIIRYHKSEIEITGVTNSTNAVGELLRKVSIELNEDPLRTEEGSGTVIVLHPQHGFSNGASVTIEGAEAILNSQNTGITETNLNGTFTITLIDDDKYSYTAGSGDTAGDSQDGGGTNVRIIGHPPTRTWDEEVYNAYNGFPTTARFHQQRLFFAGGAIPDIVVGSKLAEFFNFDIGDAEDVDAIQINISSDEVNRILHLVSGKNLEIFTTTGEFFLKPQVGRPITPTDLQIVKQSSLGTVQKCMPRIFDGAALFIQPNGKSVREYFYNSANEEYTPNLLTVLSPQAISNPQDTGILKSTGLRTEMFMLFANDDGSLGCFMGNRDQKLQGWVIWTTDGEYESVAGITKFLYASVKRTIDGATKYYLEQFGNSQFELPTDCSVSKTISGSYQPYGTVLVNGAVTSKSAITIDGCTSQPFAGETIEIGSTEYVIQSVHATGVSNEYQITLNTTLSASDNASVTFKTSRTFTGLDSSPDLTAKVVHATSGTTEDDTIQYYGSGTVSSAGVVVFDTPASAIDIGLSFDIDIQTLSIDAVQPIRGLGTTYGLPRKIGKTIIELSQTYDLQVNSNDVLLTNNGFEMVGFTGKKDVHTLGYSQEPFVTISQSKPMPLRILSITSEVYY